MPPVPFPATRCKKSFSSRSIPKTPSDYKKLARFFLQSQRYGEARQVLQGLLKARPGLNAAVVAFVAGDRATIGPAVGGRTQAAARCRPAPVCSRQIGAVSCRGRGRRDLAGRPRHAGGLQDSPDATRGCNRAAQGPYSPHSGHHRPRESQADPGRDRRRDWARYAGSHGGLPAKRRRSAYQR